MALINCPECKKEVSDMATACPYCGFPITDYLDNEDTVEESDTSEYPYCHSLNENNSAYCESCGIRLTPYAQPMDSPGSSGSVHKDDPIVLDKSKDTIPEKPRKNTWASTGFALCIISLLLVFLSPTVGVVIGIIAVVMCIPGVRKNIGISIIGLILGLIAVSINFAGMAFQLEANKKDATSSSYKIQENAMQKPKYDSNLETATQEPEYEDIPEIIFNTGVIWEGYGCTITLLAGNENRLDFQIENSSTKDYSISVHSYSINNLMAGGHQYGSDVDVPAGKKAKYTLNIDDNLFLENEPKKIDLVFWAYYGFSRDWESEVISLSTSLDDGGYFSFDTPELYSDDDLTVYYLEQDEDKYVFGIRNNNSYNITYDVVNYSINEWAYDLRTYGTNIWNEMLMPNTYGIFEITVNNKFLEEYSIPSIEIMEFNIEINSNTKTDKIKLSL